MDDELSQWITGAISPHILLSPLPDAKAAEVVERLKQEADRHWHIDPNRSVEFAERIMAIGYARNDSRQIALGLMARGDALKLLGQMQEAWDMLEQAGKIYESIGDEVGWGRTRIGRLYLGLQLNCVSETLADGERARSIFTQYGEHERLLRLDWQMAFVYVHLGQQHRALQLYESALASAESLGEAGKQYFGSLYASIGTAYEALGDFHRALQYYEQARALAIAQSETLSLAMVEGNIAEIAQAQGHYQKALTLLHDILERGIHESPLDAVRTKQHMVECYLSLNRYAEARELAQQVIRDYRTFNVMNELAYTLLCLATAEAKVGNFANAQAALEEAESRFQSLGSTTWVAMSRLKRGQVALKQSNTQMALQEAIDAAKYFEADGQHVNNATATLLQGQAMFKLGHLESASEAGQKTLQIAQLYNVPALRYAAHLLLGQIAEARENHASAMRRYRAAAATIERVQRGLTITLRPGFLEDKGEALRRMISLDLRSGHVQSALESLERAKSQIWLGYLANRETLRWSQKDERSRALMEELNQLRAEHQWFNHLVHELPKDQEHSSAVPPEQALAEVTKRERRMRAITERLYLHSGGGQWTNQAPNFSLEQIQQLLHENTLLIEYYNDGEQLWAFALEKQSLHLYRLPLTNAVLNQLIRQLQINLAAALKIQPDSPITHNHTQLAQRILKRLHDFLVGPLHIGQSDPRRLLIVPYGALHFLPFQLLYDGSAYLIEHHEVVTLPAAGLIARKAPIRPSGAVVLAHSWDGQLPQTQTEAQIVHALFGGRLYLGDAANRSSLQNEPAQILHIAAHGQHRLDQPDLSYIQLADGQLYADDVLQQDLSYELVTLSACETGRANVATDEELIGLGRGFLYAGAGALILSLWGVADDSTTNLMEQMYGALNKGQSKSAALREAQTSILAENRNLHPAFWGAFQLIGDDSPLSV